MASYYFCTLFDSGYLLKGLAMIRSLERFCPNLKIYVLCLDEQVKSILERLEPSFVSCVTLAEVEDERLLEAKADRSVAEYCWTLSSCFTWYVMENNPEVHLLTYIDADVFFYSDVRALFNEIDDASIAVVEHRFTERLRDREVNGRFCVEWNSFRRDEQGVACLSRWREQCIEWCYYRLEDGKMGDQKYLDEWPHRYDRCHIILHSGAGIAPWNYAQYKFTQNEVGKIFVDGQPLIFYHFHQFQILETGEFERLSAFYTSECREPDPVYRVYEDELRKCLVDVGAIFPDFNAGIKRPTATRAFALRTLRGWVRKVLHYGLHV